MLQRRAHLGLGQLCNCAFAGTNQCALRPARCLYTHACPNEQAHTVKVCARKPLHPNSPCHLQLSCRDTRVKHWPLQETAVPVKNTCSMQRARLVVEVLLVGGARVQRLPLDAQNGLDLLSVHVLAAIHAPPRQQRAIRAVAAAGALLRRRARALCTETSVSGFGMWGRPRRCRRGRPAAAAGARPVHGDTRG